MSAGLGLQPVRNVLTLPDGFRAAGNLVSCRTGFATPDGFRAAGNLVSYCRTGFATPVRNVLTTVTAYCRTGSVSDGNLVFGYMAKILIIDDDQMICKSLSRIFQDMGHEVLYALTLKQGVKEAKLGDFDIVFLDVKLPDGNGLKHLPVIREVPSLPEIIIITGHANPDSAELAIRNHAWDYIRKPASIDVVTLVLTRALQYREEKKAGKSAVTLKSIKREGIIGSSPGIINCLDLVARAAGSNANILISGETGTGKELFARAVHANSFRAEENFVAVDCTSLPKTLIENLLFGHAKGAFTGADKKEDGLVKHADGGTLFLDEIGELPLTTQKTFLRVLQERQFRPLGNTREIKSDFRLVSASNRNLGEMAKLGKFRKDLLYRLRSITIHLPPSESVAKMSGNLQPVI